MKRNVERYKGDDRPLPKPLAYALAKAESEHHLAERSIASRKITQRRVLELELEAILKDARVWMNQNPLQPVPVELKKIIGRAVGKPPWTQDRKAKQPTPD